MMSRSRFTDEVEVSAVEAVEARIRFREDWKVERKEF